MTESGETVASNAGEKEPGSAKSTKGKRTRGKDKPRPQTKVVIRRLPPTMEEETFWKQIEPIPENDCRYYVPADWSLGQNASCRAYINFVCQDDIFIFKDKFDGYVFVDVKGAEYPAVVEFATFQQLPHNKSRKKDNKSATIESEQHFIDFMEVLKNEESGVLRSESKMEYSFQIKDDKKITSTPLLEFLASKRQEKRDEKKKKYDDKRRQRDEERVRNKKKVIQRIGPSIKEEDGKTGDDATVKMIKPRLDDNVRGKKDNAKPLSKKKRSEERAKVYLEEKERRRAEKDTQRKATKEKKDPNNMSESGETVENVQKPNDSEPTAPDSGTVKKEVKKYSESRKERQAKMEQTKNERRNKQDEKRPDVKKDQHEKAPGERETKSDAQMKPKESSGEPSQRSIRRNAERTARKIRNKDRPTLQIYQPGKLRLKKPDEEDDARKQDEPKSNEAIVKLSQDNDNVENPPASDVHSTVELDN